MYGKDLSWLQIYLYIYNFSYIENNAHVPYLANHYATNIFSLDRPHTEHFSVAEMKYFTIRQDFFLKCTFDLAIFIYAVAKLSLNYLTSGENCRQFVPGECNPESCKSYNPRDPVPQHCTV